MLPISLPACISSLLYAEPVVMAPIRQIDVPGVMRLAIADGQIEVPNRQLGRLLGATADGVLTLRLVEPAAAQKPACVPFLTGCLATACVVGASYALAVMAQPMAIVLCVVAVFYLFRSI